MAGKTDIGPKISLQGEREFRNAINEINNGLKVNASAIALVTAKYSDNANSVTALTEKNIVLENKIASQTEKIAKLREALTNSATQYGEADKRTMAWQVSLNNAEAELIKSQSELKKNNEQLQQAQKDMKKYGITADDVADKTGSFGNKVADLANSLGVNLPAGADKAIRAMDGAKVSTAALLGVTVGLITGFGKLTVETAKTADELLTLSSVTGLSTDTLQEFNYAAEFVDVSSETMTGAMRKMIKSMDDARGGSKEAKEAFKELHLSITDNGKLKNSEQMFYEIIDALGKMTNETERDAVAMKVFGKSAQELNPLIESGSKRLKELGQEAQKMGYVMDSNTLESFGKLDDAMQKFNRQGDTMKQKLALVLLPVLTSLFGVLNKIDPKILATVAIIGSIAIVGITVAKAIGNITNTFSAMNPAALKTTLIIVGVTAALIALAAIIAVIIGKGDDLDKAMKNVGSSVNNMTNTVGGAGKKIGYNAIGTSNWRGGYTWVGENGPEIIEAPAGSKIYSNKKSMEMLQNSISGGGDTYIFQPGSVVIDAKNVKDFNDVVEATKRRKQALRAGVVMA